MRPATTQKRLDAIPSISKAGKRVNGLFRLLADRVLWHRAYEKIASNKGSLTPGVDGQTFDGISLEKIEAVAARVLDGTYKPRPVRRVYIPKANGKMRPLGIPTVTDRLVQEVVRSILDLVYEPIFSDHSHGFRERRSCHTALTHIKDVWSGVKWFVEVDIEGYFDNIDHAKLLNLLAEKIDDKRFLRLVGLFLRAGFLEDWRYGSTYSGTPQGGILSPLLANIYLHGLDEFMEGWIARRNTGKHRAKSPEYERVRGRALNRRKRIEVIEAMIRGGEVEAETVREELESLRAECARLRETMFKTPSKNPLDPGYRRYRYVRYADDFLIGVIGSKADAEEVMVAVKSYVAGLHLEVSEAKSAVRHARDGVIFLGYDVHTWTWPKLICRVESDIHGSYRKRSAADRMTLNVPRAKVRKFCNSHGFGDLDTLTPSDRGAMMASSEFEVVTQCNAEFRGFAQYYCLAGNVKTALSPLQLVVKGCILKTIAGKRRSSASVVSRQMKKGQEMYATSPDIHGKPRSVRVWLLKHLSPPRGPGKTDERPLPRHMSRNDAVDLLHVQECSNCGSNTPPFELHHVRRLADHAATSFMEFIEAARKRKRIPLCVPCHKDLHAGRLRDYRGRKAEGEMESGVH